MFTRKHYEKIALYLKQRKMDAIGSVQHDYIDSIIMDFIRMFELDNPKFDREKFQKAVSL